MNEKYPHIVYEEYSKGTNANDGRESCVAIERTDDIEGYYLWHLFRF